MYLNVLNDESIEIQIWLWNTIDMCFNVVRSSIFGIYFKESKLKTIKIFKNINYKTHI